MPRARIWIASFFLIATSFAKAESWAPNDERLKIDPTTSTDSYGAVQAYIQHASLDRLAAQLESNNGKGVAYIVNDMVNDMVVKGINTLYDKGFKADADRLLHEYDFTVKGKIVDSWDLGDHEPWSQWLVKFYAELVRLLGQDLVNYLRLDDINEVNYAVPVVFHPKDPRWDMIEYRKHFVPLAGAIGYWVPYISCEAITYGSGWILICMPIGDICEKVVVNYIAPDLSDRIYKKANNIP